MKKKRLLIYFSICLALLTLLGVSFFYLRKLNALEKNSERVDHSYQVIILTNRLEQNLLNAETNQRGYLFSGNSDFLESYLSELKGIPGILSRLDHLTADNASQQQHLDSLREVINRQLNILKQNMTSLEEDSIQVASFHESQVQMSRLRELIEVMKVSENGLLSERSINKTLNTNESKRSSYLSMLISFLLCCIASAAIIWFFNRSENYRVALEDRLLQLTTLNAEIRDLTIASAHNLQEPMRKVQMIIDWMQHQELRDPLLVDKLNRIRDIYSRQQLTNNKIVEYYDILLHPGERTRVDLNALVEQLRLKHSWGAEFELSIDLLPVLSASRVQMELLFTSLIQNAIQFRDGQRPLHIRIHAVLPDDPAARPEKEYHCIAVSDNGMGVEEEFLEKIFGLFQKIEPSPYNHLQSGMGLSFCKRILLNHGGSISARKNGGNGLTVLLFFPKIQ